MRVLINASNLHVGGGIQVATSFISELFEMKKFEFSIVCSTKVYQNLSDSIITDKFISFHVVDVFGSKRIRVSDRKYFDSYNICFTIFGPFYHRLIVDFHICGFAQAWIAYPNNEAYSKLSLAERLRFKAKFLIQKYYFKRVDQLVVEQNHIKHALSYIGFDRDKIEVVSNCVSSIYDNPQDWLPFESDLPDNNKITIGFIGRAYSHKNLNILAKVNDILLSKYKVNVNFLFTLTSLEMTNLKFESISNFYNVGLLSVQQCPNFYSKIDFLIFPSLLECFSASPIESMKMGTPVIASDRSFIRDICGEAGTYFDPLDPTDIADKVVQLILDENLCTYKISLGHELAKNLPEAKDRASSYVHIIENALKII